MIFKDNTIVENLIQSQYFVFVEIGVFINVAKKLNLNNNIKN